MKTQNMDKLVDYISEYIKGDPQYSPYDTQYSRFIKIFLDENQNDAHCHLDAFSPALFERLIEKDIKGLDVDDKETSEKKKYYQFIDTWFAWNVLYNELRNEGRLK